MNVSYKDSEALSTATEKSLRENIEEQGVRIEQLQTEFYRTRSRINRFVAAVYSVQFDCDEESAVPWMSEWGAFLLSGREPEPQPEVADEDIDTQSE